MPCCSAYQAGRSRVCLNIPHSIYNSRNKLKPHRLCACHVQCPSHFFPRAALIQPLKSTWGVIFRVIRGYFPTSSRGEIPGSFLFTQCCSRCRFPSLSAALRRQKWSCKAENLVKNARWWKALRKDGDAPEQALIMAPIICWLLSEPEQALRERDLGCEAAEMGYPLVQLAAAPKPGCCRVCKVLPGGRASCQKTVLPVLPAPRSCL